MGLAAFMGGIVAAFMGGTLAGLLEALSFFMGPASAAFIEFLGFFIAAMMMGAHVVRSRALALWVVQRGIVV